MIEEEEFDEMTNEEMIDCYRGELMELFQLLEIISNAEYLTRDIFDSVDKRIGEVNNLLRIFEGSQ